MIHHTQTFLAKSCCFIAIAQYAKTAISQPLNYYLDAAMKISSICLVTETISEWSTMKNSYVLHETTHRKLHVRFTLFIGSSFLM